MLEDDKYFLMVYAYLLYVWLYVKQQYIIAKVRYMGISILLTAVTNRSGKNIDVSKTKREWCSINRFSCRIARKPLEGNKYHETKYFAMIFALYTFLWSFGSDLGFPRRRCMNMCAFTCIEIILLISQTPVKETVNICKVELMEDEPLVHKIFQPSFHC